MDHDYLEDDKNCIGHLMMQRAEAPFENFMSESHLSTDYIMEDHNSYTQLRTMKTEAETDYENIIIERPAPNDGAVYFDAYFCPASHPRFLPKSQADSDAAIANFHRRRRNGMPTTAVTLRSLPRGISRAELQASTKRLRSMYVDPDLESTIRHTFERNLGMRITDVVKKEIKEEVEELDEVPVIKKKTKVTRKRKPKQELEGG